MSMVIISSRDVQPGWERAKKESSLGSCWRAKEGTGDLTTDVEAGWE